MAAVAIAKALPHDGFGAVVLSLDKPLNIRRGRNWKKARIYSLVAKG